MQIEIIDGPVTNTSGNAASEKARIRVTEDDQTTHEVDTRAIRMRLGNIMVEAFLTVTEEGETTLALITFQTMNVLPEGQVGKVINRAVVDDEGNLDAVSDEPFCDTESEFSDTASLLEFITEQIQAAGS